MKNSHKYFHIMYSVTNQIKLHQNQIINQNKYLTENGKKIYDPFYTVYVSHRHFLFSKRENSNPVLPDINIDLHLYK